MKTGEKTGSVFGKRIRQLRKEHGWSQPIVGKKIGTSGQIVGRHELGQITPSIDVARKFAEVFEVTLDSLVSERDMPDILKNRGMVERWNDLQQLSEDDRAHVLSVMDGFIRDAKTRRTYKAG